MRRRRRAGAREFREQWPGWTRNGAVPASYVHSLLPLALFLFFRKRRRGSRREGHLHLRLRAIPPGPLVLRYTRKAEDVGHAMATIWEALAMDGSLR